MSTIQKVAEAFAAGNSAKCGNASTDGSGYKLHRTVIAVKRADGGLTLNWGGHYTPTTANHLNHILEAFGVNRRVSWAQARDTQETLVHIDC